MAQHIIRLRAQDVCTVAINSVHFHIERS